MKKFAVSVIIPMYNCERYVGKCLDSLLNQTFQNFEVIVVDDCSTDNSVAVVENYRERFGGRLTLTKTEGNSGGGGYVPRNIGLELSRGKYIFFVDADDFILETALEILHTAAKNSNADVVYTPKYYRCNADGTVELMIDDESAAQGVEDKMTLTAGRSKEICRRLINGLFHMPWAKFVTRKLLIDNAVTFPKIFSSGDFLWSIQVACHTERFLRLPIALYFYRDNPESITNKKISAEKQIAKCARAVVAGAEALNALTGKVPLLKSEPFLMFVALKYFLNNFLYRTVQARAELSNREMYEILSLEFFAAEGVTKLTVPFFMTVIDAQQSKMSSDEKLIAKLQAEVKRLTEE